MASRRRILSTLASIPWLAPAFAAEPGSVAGQSVGAVDPGVVLDYVKVRASTDAKLNIAWGRGIQYGCVNGALTPLFGRDVVVSTTAEAMPDGVWRIKTREALFATDLARNQPLYKMINPLNGSDMTIPNTPATEFAVDVDKTGRISLATPPRAGVDYRSWLTRARMMNVEAGADERLSVHVVEPDGRTRWLEEILQHRADAPTAARAALPKYAGRRSTLALRSWPQWTGLEGQEGFTLAIYQSRNISTLDDVPTVALEACQAMQPEFLKEVSSVLTG